MIPRQLLHVTIHAALGGRIISSEMVFFFSSRRRHTRLQGDWSSDVCSSDLDAEEAAIIAEAGRPGAVTVSTQMAGRGIDIRLGGSAAGDGERVAGLGGLYVIGTGRHNSRRVDDQLRGRAGRQGDPGGSVFFASGEDELITTNDVHFS